MLATQFIIEHDTTDEQISRATVDELREAIVSFGTCPPAKRKAELVEQAKSIRLRMATAHATAEAIQEQNRKERLDAEIADGKTKTAHAAIGRAFRSSYESAREKIAEFQKKVSEANLDTNAITSEIEWRAEDVFHAYARMHEFANLAGFFEKQAQEQTKLSGEVHEVIVEMAQDQTDRVLGLSISQSTNPVANVRHLAELKAAGLKAKVLNRLARMYPELVAKGDASRAENMFFCL